MVIAKQVSDVHTPMLTQMMSYEFLTRYDLSSHIEKLRALYGKRCKTMLDAIDEYFPEDCDKNFSERRTFLSGATSVTERTPRRLRKNACKRMFFSFRAAHLWLI